MEQAETAKTERVGQVLGSGCARATLEVSNSRWNSLAWIRRSIT
ncbi:MAG: hypothetical protein R2881_10805 [Eubacteriales bacterium]